MRAGDLYCVRDTDLIYYYYESDWHIHERAQQGDVIFVIGEVTPVSSDWYLTYIPRFHDTFLARGDTWDSCLRKGSIEMMCQR